MNRFVWPRCLAMFPKGKFLQCRGWLGCCKTARWSAGTACDATGSPHGWLLANNAGSNTADSARGKVGPLQNHPLLSRRSLRCKGRSAWVADCKQRRKQHCGLSPEAVGPLQHRPPAAGAACDARDGWLGRPLANIAGGNIAVSARELLLHVKT
jgi:hypothetical protein